jgi:hypothetical protein
MKGFDTPEHIPTLPFTISVRRKASADAMFRIAARELMHDQRLHISSGILEEAINVVILMGILDTLANPQELFAGVARPAQRKLDHRVHDRALEGR